MNALTQPASPTVSPTHRHDQTLAQFREDYLGMSPPDRRSLCEWLYRLEAVGGLNPVLGLGVEVVFNAASFPGDEHRVAVTPSELRRIVDCWDRGAEAVPVG